VIKDEVAVVGSSEIQQRNKLPQLLAELKFVIDKASTWVIDSCPAMRVNIPPYANHLDGIHTVNQIHHGR